MLRGPGERGLEAVVVWVGRLYKPDVIEVVSAHRPRQIAYAGPTGLAVEVPPDALSDLIAELPPDAFVAVRVHTHPTDAYHSSVDDQNMLISHDGAISIVVPNFARDEFDLLRCSVNELRHGAGWAELSAADVASRFTVR